MKSKKKEFDLGFGDPVCVRDTLNQAYSMPINLIKIQDISYPSPLGNEELIQEIIKIKPLAGNSNIVLTTGTNQAINIILRVLKKRERLR